MPQRRDLFRSAAAIALRRAAGAARPPAAPPRLPLPLGESEVVGTRYHAAPRVAATLQAGMALLLVREPANERDPWAIAVHSQAGDKLGYIPRGENRRLAGLMDAGAEIAAHVEEGYPLEVTPGNWRISARLALRDGQPAPPPGPVGRDQVAHVLAAAPLMLERPNYVAHGPRALMLAGPCAGWQRRGAEWLPPGAAPWPSAGTIERHFQLVTGPGAVSETGRALQAAARLGLPGYGAAGAPPPRPPVVPPAERPRLLARGWLDAPGLPEAEAGRRFGPLHHLVLRREWGRGLTVYDTGFRRIARLPPQLAAILTRLMDEGFSVDIAAQPGGPELRRNGGLRIPYDIRLRGDDPPGVARHRASCLHEMARMLPESWDADAVCGPLRTAVLWEFVKLSELVAHHLGGRLTEELAQELLDRAHIWAGPE
jgi:hypothetical protein